VLNDVGSFLISAPYTRQWDQDTLTDPSKPLHTPVDPAFAPLYSKDLHATLAGVVAQEQSETDDYEKLMGGKEEGVLALESAAVAASGRDSRATESGGTKGPAGPAADASGLAAMVGVPGAVMSAIDAELVRPMEGWLAAYEAAKVSGRDWW
jgi:hypothetical protein